MRSGAWPRPARGLAWFAAGVVKVLVLAVLVFELALMSTDRPGNRAVAGAFDRVLWVLPWETNPSFAEVMVRARRPPTDPLVVQGLMRRGVDPARARLDRDRFGICLVELGPTGLLAAGLLIAAGTWGRRPRAFSRALAVLTAMDLLALGHLDRPVATAPIRPLEALSPVLARLAAEPHGTRVLSSLGNLPMAVGAAAIPAYRTLDRPTAEVLTGFARSAADHADFARIRSAVKADELDALRATGVGLIVVEPLDRLPTQRHPETWPGTVERVSDPNLLAWIYGVARTRSRRARGAEYLLWRPFARLVRAWLAPSPTTEEAAREIEVLDAHFGIVPILALLNQAIPLPRRSKVPERVEIEVNAACPGLVILSQLDDPEWRARWIGPGGTRPARIIGLFRQGGSDRSGGWQGIRVPGARRWTLRLEYEGRAAKLGLVISGVAWSGWLVAYWGLGCNRKDQARGDGPG